MHSNNINRLIKNSKLYQEFEERLKEIPVTVSTISSSASENCPEVVSNDIFIYNFVLHLK